MFDLNCIPHVLYKYRKCNEQNFEAFYNDQIWCTYPNQMNDAYDSRMTINKQRVIEWINKVTSKDVFTNMLDRVKDLANNSQKYNKKEEITKPNLEIINCFKEEKQKLIKQIEFNCNESYEKYKEDINIIKEQLMDLLYNTKSYLQNNITLSSFSEIITSPTMWGLYSNDEEGYALSYCFDGNSILSYMFSSNLNNVPFVIKQIKYSNKKYEIKTDSITDYLKFKLLSKNNSFPVQVICLGEDLKDYNALEEIFNIICHKYIDWEYEKEWRLIHFIKPSNIFSIKANGLYLGRRISKINEKILTDIAKEKNIPIYKMEINDDSAEYKLKAILQK